MVIGLLMIILAGTVESLLKSKDIYGLTILFFLQKLLIATQDICVDGWALTLLSEENAGAAANCNAAGQSIGVFFGYGVFMALHSSDFCNRWLRAVPQGMVFF